MFWQTPIPSVSSPFTPIGNKKDVDCSTKGVEISLEKELHNFLNKDSVMDLEVAMQKLEDGCLDQLIDELIQVFCFENISNST